MIRHVVEKYKTRIIIFFLSVFIVTYIYNKFAFHIDEFNASLRIFLKTGSFLPERTFKNGIPISHSPKIGDYISPFYVVHYAILYSDKLCSFGKINNELLCRKDPSLKYWNIYPKFLDKSNEKEVLKYFKNCLEWLYNNVKYINGKAHFIYNFDWPYKNFVSGKLKAPWRSGLTDSYAIKVFLRGYELFGKKKYLKLAHDLYLSSLTPVSDGGDLNDVVVPWIEEYIDPTVNPKFYPHVLNGMIYAYKSISLYEDYVNMPNQLRKSNILLMSILKELSKFSNGKYWSFYSFIDSANIKYHIIHVSLLNELEKDVTNSSSKNTYKYLNQLHKIYENWVIGAKNPGIFYVLYGPKSIAYYNFILMYFFSVIFIYFFILKLYTFLKSKN